MKRNTNVRMGRGRRGNPKKNPGTLDQARELSSKFHGRPSTEDDLAEAYETETYDTNLAGLGQLVELEILVGDGDNVIPISWQDSSNRPLVCSNVDGDNLEFIGGDQDLTSELEEFEIEDNGKRLIEIGEVFSISYFADKHHLQGPKSQERGTEYIHEFGEEGGERPILMWDSKDKKMKLVGGSYRVEEEGIKD